MSATTSKESLRKAELILYIKTMLKPLVENLVRPLVLRELANSPLTSKEMEEVSDVVEMEAGFLLYAWMQTFVCGQPACDGWHYVQANMIDDAMLPPLNKNSSQVFQEQLLNTDYLDEAQALDILRQLRASLPAGKVLPDELIELLVIWRVKIV